MTDPARRAELVPRLKELFARAEGVARVLDGSEAPSLGMPTPAENEAMGELILFAKEGYSFNNAATGDAPVAPAVNYAGSHGFPSADPELDGLFIANGAGIKPGVKLDRVRNLDVAPTIAHLLGVRLPNVDGQVMTAILAGAK